LRILIAPDSFKETLSAVEAADAIADGVHRVDPSITVDRCPIADGGEGTVETLVAAKGGVIRESRVIGPLGQSVNARWGVIPRGCKNETTAVIEIAEAAGLHLIPTDQRDPTRTTTYGVGQLILEAIDAECSSILIGLGGSATCDGAIGLAQALGATFEIEDAQALQQPLTGGDLLRIRSINTDTHRIPDQIHVAVDVTNPLFGPHGSAATYGPQKGATPEQVDQLDRGLRHLATFLPETDPMFPGAGSAGGLGFGLVAFCHAQTKRGIDLILRMINFNQRLQGNDLVITGEGRLDEQTGSGKAVHGVAEAAQQADIPVIALVGEISSGLHPLITEAYELTETGCTPTESRSDPTTHLTNLTEQVIRRWLSA